MKIELENTDIEHIAEVVSGRLLEILKPMLSNSGDADRLMTTENLCKYLQVKEGWIYQQVHSKTLPYLKAGNKLLFRKADIDKYLSNGRK